MGSTISRRPLAMMRTTRDLKSTSDSSGSSEFVPQARHAFKSHAGVQEEPDDRGVPPVAEAFVGAVGQQMPDVIIRQNGYRLLRDLRRTHLGHRRSGDLALFLKPVEELL